MFVAGRTFSPLNSRFPATCVVENCTPPEIKRDFPGRDGYDPQFLGSKLPLPQLSPNARQQVAPLLEDPTKSELKYTHFSVVMSKMRRLPYFTAVNIDGSQLRSVPRNDRWGFDDRIAREHQLGHEAYRHSHFDRGHMVRRLDPVWGPDAEQANDDTFVFTNAALQHRDLNRKEWVALEEHLLSHARTTDGKMTVMTGPVLAESDPGFDNDGRLSPATQIPRQFWKVAIWNNPVEGLKGTAFVLSQSDLLGSGDRQSGDLDPGRFEVYQVPIGELEAMTQIRFTGVSPVGETTTETKKLGNVGEVELGTCQLASPIVRNRV